MQTADFGQFKVIGLMIKTVALRAWSKRRVYSALDARRAKSSSSSSSSRDELDEFAAGGAGGSVVGTGIENAFSGAAASESRRLLRTSSEICEMFELAALSVGVGEGGDADGGECDGGEGEGSLSPLEPRLCLPLPFALALTLLALLGFGCATFELGFAFCLPAELRADSTSSSSGVGDEAGAAAATPMPWPLLPFLLSPRRCDRDPRSASPLLLGDSSAPVSSRVRATLLLPCSCNPCSGARPETISTFGKKTSAMVFAVTNTSPTASIRLSACGFVRKPDSESSSTTTATNTIW